MSEALAAKKKKLAVIDGKSVFYRGYYAMPNLSTKDGTPTGGVYGFAVMALEVIKRLKPDYVAVAWDKPKTNIRRRLELYPAYKAGRKPAPPDFKIQIPILHELLAAFDWPLYELDDYEADDIMGTLAVQASAQDIETMLITSDMDMLQLVDPHVHVFALKKGLSNIELYSPASFEAKYSIRANQFLDLKALKGDSSDNIPGVPGIGEKGAIELLKAHKTLDGVYDNLALLKDSMRRKLEAGKDSAYLSRQLAAIWTDAPVPLDLDRLDMSHCEPQRILDILQKLEFRTLARQLPDVMRVPPEAAESKVKGQRPRGFSQGKLVLVDTAIKLQALDLGGGGIAVHSRTAGKHGRDPHILIVSPSHKETYVLDLTKLDTDAVRGKLAAIKSVIGYDVKATLKVFKELDLRMPPVAHDVLVGAFLLNSLRREQSLTDLASSGLEYEGEPFEDLDDSELIARAAEVTGIIHALYAQQADALKELPKVKKLAAYIEWPVIPVLAAMEYEGIRLDIAQLVRMAEEISDTISDLEQQIYGHANAEFNISSPMQLADILFTKLQLPNQGIKRGKTGYSTAASELDKLRGLHPVIDLITQYREVTKLKNTYVDTLPKMIDGNSRVHTTYNLTIAQTGRLSSVDPNLQNIPVRTELGRKIRAAFVADPGNVLVSADYSQFELRLAAYLCNDQNLIDMFNDDTDVHVVTAAQIYGREPEDITKNMRRDAKVVNFGVMYGLSTHGLVAATGMTYQQAKTFIDRYFEVRPKLLSYIESVKTQAREQGYVETLLGRRRPTPDVHSSNFAVREAATRAAVNMPFQGSAADIMKLAMVRAAEKFQGTSAKILLQIHDSLIVECPEAEAVAVAKTLKQTMEQAYKLPVKLTVDTTIAHSWGEL